MILPVLPFAAGKNSDACTYGLRVAYYTHEPDVYPVFAIGLTAIEMVRLIAVRTDHDIEPSVLVVVCPRLTVVESQICCNGFIHNT